MMKTTYSTIHVTLSALHATLSTLLFTLSSLLITLSSLTCLAQPSPVKKASKGILKITTFKADGSILTTGYGAFVDANGTAITAWTPYVGARSAIAIDAKGTKYDVDCIYGASEIYDVARIKVSLPAKPSFTPLTIEQGQIADGQEAWFVTYDIKTPTFTKFTPAKIETFQTDMPYYVFEQEKPDFNETFAGTPFLNAQGQLMGLMKTSSTRTDLYCASARYAMTLQPSALTLNDNVLRNTKIRIALPDDYNKAVLALVMNSQRPDSINYPATLMEFITKFPDKEDGYEYQAAYLTDKDDEHGADEAMQKAIEVSTQKDNAHYFYSKLIYNKELLKPDSTDSWNLDMALKECDDAIIVNPLPLYHIQKGKILFSQKKFTEALTEFNGALKEGFRDADVYYFAYQCLGNMRSADFDNRAQQLEMLDSACVIAPKQVLYQSEKALLLMKMHKVKDAITVCQNIVTMAPYYGEGHGLLGLALCIAGQKPTGVAELKRAKALGYQQADAFIAKYGGENPQP